MGAGRAEIGGDGEAPFDQRQPFGEVLRRPGEQEIRRARRRLPRPGAIEAAIDERAIENPRRRRRRHGPSLMRQTAPRAKPRFGLTLATWTPFRRLTPSKRPARRGRDAAARSSRAWLEPRSTRSIRRPALPAAPRRICMARSARAAGARCASSSGRFASASGRRSSRTSGRASSRRRRWPIRRCSPAPGRWRGSRTGRRARSPIGSNIPTAPSSPGRSPAGWRAPAPTCSPTPIS